jgi:hypothetical protein
VARKVIAVKKYVVTLSDGERDQLNAMIKKGRHPARQQLKGLPYAKVRKATWTRLEKR